MNISSASSTIEEGRLSDEAMTTAEGGFIATTTGGPVGGPNDDHSPDPPMSSVGTTRSNVADPSSTERRPDCDRRKASLGMAALLIVAFASGAAAVRTMMNRNVNDDEPPSSNSARVSSKSHVEPTTAGDGGSTDGAFVVHAIEQSTANMRSTTGTTGPSDILTARPSTSLTPTPSPSTDASNWIEAFNLLIMGQGGMSTTSSTSTTTTITAVSPTITTFSELDETTSNSTTTTDPTINLDNWMDAFSSIPAAEGTGRPTPHPSIAATREPTSSTPTLRPNLPMAISSSPTERCFTIDTYDAIDGDIETLANDIDNERTRSHFLGGIVRLAAHDFMDYDPNDSTDPMGPDGCFDPSHPSNAGLPDDVWCANCTLRLLHDERYPHVSRADFWIASANAVIRQASIDNALDLRDTFVWGRRDRDTCSGSGDRLPTPSGCDKVEGVFLERMGLTWADAVALLGAHTLGRGAGKFSGHEGTWVDTDEDAQVFDKQYYEEIYLNSWRPRNMGESNQDWTTGRTSSEGNIRMMLNTDICLVHNIDGNLPCCTRTGVLDADGQDTCVDLDAAASRCPMIDQSESRWEAREAVGSMLGGSYPNSNNEPFYSAFATAWRKATTVGQSNLSPLVESCEAI